MIGRFFKDEHFKKTFFDNDQILYCFVDSNYIIIRISPASAKLLGYTHQELEGKSMINFVDINEFKEIAPLYQYMAMEKKKSFLYHTACYRDKNGKQIKFQCLEPFYIEDSGVWLLKSYQIGVNTTGINILTDEYKKQLKE